MANSGLQTTADYEFLGIIDKPKTGVTYKVRNRTSGALEVLRTLPGASANDPESRDRFLREIRIHTRLAHPNIAAFHDAFDLDGQLVMTAEYLEGSTLAQLCAHGPLPFPEAARVVSEVLSGLEEAHALGIIHRGITSAHVHITPSGAVKLGGFGLAKPADDVHLTQTGTVLGDPRYISPEQVMGVHPLDARADLYSVSIVLYQALTGKVPFDGANDFDIMVEQVRGVPRPPREINPLVPAELDRLVLIMLAKHPDARIPSARSLRNALLGLVPVPEPVPISPPALPPAPGIHFFHPTVIFGTISLTIILTVLLYVAFH